MERPLAGLERIYWLIGPAQSANGVAIVNLRGQLDVQAFERAVAAAARRHPLLAVRIEERDDGPWFVGGGVAPPPVRAMERAPPPEDPRAWLRATEEEMATPFSPATGPLVRFRVLQGRGADGSPEDDVLLTMHHAVGDILSAHRVLTEVLGAAAGVRPVPAERVEAPPINALLPAGVSPKPASRQVLRALVHKARGIPHVLPRERDVPQAQRSSRMLHRTLDEEATAGLVRACKSQRTSVHGALTAAHLLAAAPEVREGRGGHIALANPANLRPYLARPVGESFGYYSFGVTTVHKVTPSTPFWRLARHVASEVKRELDRGTALAAVAMFEGLPKRAEAGPALLQRFDEARLPAVGVSNLGRLEAPVQGPLAWTGFHGAAGVDTQGAQLLTGAMTVAGRLDLTSMHPEPLVGRERARRMVDAVVEHLHRASARGAGA